MSWFNLEQEKSALDVGISADKDATAGRGRPRQERGEVEWLVAEDAELGPQVQICWVVVEQAGI